MYSVSSRIQKGHGATYHCCTLSCKSDTQLTLLGISNTHPPQLRVQTESVRHANIASYYHYKGRYQVLRLDEINLTCFQFDFRHISADRFFIEPTDGSQSSELLVIDRISQEISLQSEFLAITFGQNILFIHLSVVSMIDQFHCLKTLPTWFILPMNSRD